MSSESALRTELLLEEALETEETLLTLRDLERANSPLQSQMQQEPGSDETDTFVSIPLHGWDVRRLLRQANNKEETKAVPPGAHTI